MFLQIGLNWILLLFFLLPDSLCHLTGIFITLTLHIILGIAWFLVYHFSAWFLIVSSVFLFSIPTPLPHFELMKKFLLFHLSSSIGFLATYLCIIFILEVTLWQNDHNQLSVNNVPFYMKCINFRQYKSTTFNAPSLAIVVIHILSSYVT